MRALQNILLLVSIFTSTKALSTDIPTSSRAERAISGIEAQLKKELAEKDLKYGAPIFIRIFKDPGVLEVWVEAGEGVFSKFKSYEICTFSGELGPKLREGDNQSPEGFYFVNSARLNPWSKFHLSFNLGYPNTYDRNHGRTGSALMVHGNCVSIGCYAMTDTYINEIYALGVAALQSGQPFFRVHSFPFQLEPETLSKYKSNQWYSFWLNLKEGYDYFKKHKRPPNVEVSEGKYIFGP
ncbi:murein L,D-transpeptidase [Pseudoalteromonas sp. SG43-6]|uniref:L,D-transpeptidase family protein n=1 Tax=Pseudoalteromonas sp. SG43-6 TaxID=2760967 RepID=UPI001600C7E7|nr:murein L,D-transpeptidase family protein [Pseudoalteromonas sp. SG43-6]MBB1436523.1 murein L,D-transpeptidase [Pseudoalteromonas sp. SG43-6]